LRGDAALLAKSMQGINQMQHQPVPTGTHRVADADSPNIARKEVAIPF
jgi:hypothetical protein